MPEMTPAASPEDRRSRPAFRRRPKLRPELAELIFPICHKYLDPRSGMTAQEIANWVKEELEERGVEDPHFSRQQIYPMISEAIRLGYVVYNPPHAKRLAQRIVDRLQVRNEQVQVVESEGKESIDPLAARAGDLVRELICRIARRKRKEGLDGEVHLGVGSGDTTIRICLHLRNWLRAGGGVGEVDKLVVHAMNCGFLPNKPESSAVACLTYFTPDSFIDVECVGLFTEAFVRAGEVRELQSRAGLTVSFECREKIDLVITSLGIPDDPEGMLNQFEKQYLELDPMAESGGRPQRRGDVQFRTYTEDGPIREDDEQLRAVTLFELDDFVRMTRDEGKYVVLVSGITKSGGTKTRALLPLLTNPDLKVWSHICMDRVTAAEVVDALCEEPVDEVDELDKNHAG